jgi:hypothetical protein
VNHRDPFTRRRRGPRRKRLIRLLIVGEGRETEFNYFDALRRENAVRESFAITVKKGKGGSREQIAQYAVERKQEASGDYDFAFCVMDVENMSHSESLGTALTLLRRNKIIACLSNPSFEIWINSHFERTSAAFNNGDAVVAHLNGHWQKHFSHDYDKACSSHCCRLVTRRANAIRHAMDVREKDHGRKKPMSLCNSATEVYRLVRWLLGGARW